MRGGRPAAQEAQRMRRYGGPCIATTPWAISTIALAARPRAIRVSTPTSEGSSPTAAARADRARAWLRGAARPRRRRSRRRRRGFAVAGHGDYARACPARARRRAAGRRSCRPRAAGGRARGGRRVGRSPSWARARGRKGAGGRHCPRWLSQHDSRVGRWLGPGRGARPGSPSARRPAPRGAARSSAGFLDARWPARRAGGPADAALRRSVHRDDVARALTATGA